MKEYKKDLIKFGKKMEGSNEFELFGQLQQDKVLK